jgi:hypothetical protein
VHAIERGATNPFSTGSLGYNASGKVVRDASKLKIGDKLVTTFANGSAQSAVEEILTKGKQNGKK